MTTTPRDRGQRQADALVEMAKQALADLLHPDTAADNPSSDAPDNDAADPAGAPGDETTDPSNTHPSNGSSRAGSPVRRRRRPRRRPKVIVTINWYDLVAGTRGGSLDAGAGRTTVSAETIRRLACDAEIHRYLTGPDDSPINYGRSRRVVSDAQ